MKNKNVNLTCRKKIAFDSNDHIMPWGTRRDNSTNPRFNEKLLKLFLHSDSNKIVNVLDLGCAGGGFVKSIIDDGHFAIGIEGSDFSQKNKRAEWRTIPDRLFTCDITEKFHFLKNSHRLLFDTITCWEVLEHIQETKLDNVLKNIKENLRESGIIICSIPNWPEEKNGCVLHHIVRPKKWWIQKFTEAGFFYLPLYVKYFQTQFVRGKWETKKNFHLVLAKNNNKIPKLPKYSYNFKSIFTAAENYWAGSHVQRFLKFIVLGEKFL
jgi:2-polyprenyl-3-methyl-5-hydroxy-6-metoxy-1,4-benzoquinol methylase